MLSKPTQPDLPDESESAALDFPDSELTRLGIPGSCPLVSVPGKARFRPLGKEFFAGRENVPAVTAVQAVLEQTAPPFNPLVLYGPAATGKSHLGWGLAALWAKRYPESKLLCYRGLEFAQDFAMSARLKRMPQFRDGFRKCGFLLLEDLDDLTGTARVWTQMRLALDDVIHSGGQVVATMRSRPAAAGDLSAALRGRLLGGLGVRLELPSLATRRALVDHWTTDFLPALPFRLKDKMAQTAASVPELFQLVQELQQRAATAGGNLADWMPSVAAGERPTVADVSRECARYYRVTQKELLGRSRQRSIALARHVAVYLASELCGLDAIGIGTHFGGRDSATILHSLQRVKSGLADDLEIRQAVEQLTLKLARRGLS